METEFWQTRATVKPVSRRTRVKRERHRQYMKGGFHIWCPQYVGIFLPPIPLVRVVTLSLWKIPSGHPNCPSSAFICFLRAPSADDFIYESLQMLQEMAAAVQTKASFLRPYSLPALPLRLGSLSRRSRKERRKLTSLVNKKAKYCYGGSHTWSPHGEGSGLKKCPNFGRLPLHKFSMAKGSRIIEET